MATHLRKVNFIKFNQDSTSLLVGTSSWYKLFSLTSLESLVHDHTCLSDCNDEVIILERLFSSSLLALVTRNDRRQLKLVNFQRQTEMSKYDFPNSIMSIKMSKERIVVCIEDAIYIHNIKNMKVVHVIRSIPPNSNGLCALSTNPDRCFLAYPTSSITGGVELFDAHNLESKSKWQVHYHALGALSFDSRGMMLATASERGTVIKIFSVESRTQLFEFRLGISHATIYNLSFSPDGQMLAVNANCDTIRIFRLPRPTSEDSTSNPEASSSWYDYVSTAISRTTSYVATNIMETLTPNWAAFTVQVPQSAIPDHYGGISNNVSIANISGEPRLLLASTNGALYVYSFPSKTKLDPCSKVSDTNLGCFIVLVPHSAIPESGIAPWGPITVEAVQVGVLKVVGDTECILSQRHEICSENFEEYLTPIEESFD